MLWESATKSPFSSSAGQLLTIYSAFVNFFFFGGGEWEYSEAVHHLFIDFKKDYDLVMREVLYSILIELGIPMKLVRLIKLYE